MQGQTVVYTTTGGSDSVIGVNAHIDSVLAGPGANDDGMLAGRQRSIAQTRGNTCPDRLDLSALCSEFFVLG